MKWIFSDPRPDSYNFNDADSLVAFAEANGIKVRGHNFVWHEALPGGLRAPSTKENAKKFLVDHIMTVGGRYKGKIHSLGCGQRGDLDTRWPARRSANLVAMVRNAWSGVPRPCLPNSTAGRPERRC